MAELIKSVVCNVLCGTYSMPSLHPKTDYRKHVPKNAKELCEKNWSSTGRALRSAMNKVRKENEHKV